jgi:hypothetical protein
MVVVLEVTTMIMMICFDGEKRRREALVVEALVIRALGSSFEGLRNFEGLLKS